MEMDAIEVLDIYYWIHNQTNCSFGGTMGQVTYCRYKDQVFYVRENLTGLPSFFISSGERWGDKIGTSKPRYERQVLELLAHPRSWAMLAEVVHQTDTLKRPVVKNRAFNNAFIKKLRQPEKDVLDFLKGKDRKRGVQRKTEQP
jgi:hypothetical protein